MNGKPTKSSEAENPPSSNGKRVPRSPDPMPGEESEIETRPLYPLEDSPEARAKELELRAYLEAQAKKKS